MELKWLEDMLVLLEEGSFSRAAERRHVTQPAFSRRIRSLEDWLGVDVVDRSTQPIRLSEAARRCEPEMRALATRLYELRSRFRSEDGHARRVSFACMHTLAVSAFPSLIQLIDASIGRTSYRLRSENKGDCITELVRGSVDFMLCYESAGRRTQLPAGMTESLLLGHDRLVPVVGGSLRYRLDERGLPPDPVPLLTYPEGSFLGQALSEACVPGLVKRHAVEWVYESAYTASVKEMVLGGMGMAWLPSSMAMRDIQSGRMLSLSGAYACCDLDIVLHCNVRSARAYAQELFGELKRVMAGRRTSGRPYLEPSLAC